jgi:hypothetical protein
MINLVSSFGDRISERGPGKVFANLVKGLDKIDYPYVINRDLDSTKRLWIHDSVSALYAMSRSKAFKVAGPNLFLLPSHIPRGIKMQGALYLQPSAWAKLVWEEAGFTACPIRTWPVGIDTETFHPPVGKTISRRLLVYHKQRDPAELQQLTEILDGLRLAYTLIVYGQYSEDGYREALSNASFVVWHGCHESQGVALQEALACDVPVLVCDVTRLSQARGGYRFPEVFDTIRVTSAPYFDESCGIKIESLSNFRASVGLMLDRLTSFAPREYVVRHLSLEGQARAFVGLWDEWDLTLDAGLLETARTQRKWRAPMSARIRSRVERRVW